MGKDEKAFSFTLFMADNPNVASKYKARVSIFNEDSSKMMTYEGEVLPIEEIPSPWGNFSELNRRCLCLPYETIRQFLWVKDIGEKGQSLESFFVHGSPVFQEEKSLKISSDIILCYYYL